jgi:hypothetical protein
MAIETGCKKFHIVLHPKDKTGAWHVFATRYPWNQGSTFESSFFSFSVLTYDSSLPTSNLYIVSLWTVLYQCTSTISCSCLLFF